MLDSHVSEKTNAKRKAAKIITEKSSTNMKEAWGLGVSSEPEGVKCLFGHTARKAASQEWTGRQCGVLPGPPGFLGRRADTITMPFYFISDVQDKNESKSLLEESFKVPLTIGLTL